MTEAAFILAVAIGFLLIGYGLSEMQIRVLRKENELLRQDMAQRELLLRACFETAQIPINKGAKNRVLDRSPKAIAEIKRRQRVADNAEEWREATAETVEA
jgi:hypothetical protein